MRESKVLKKLAEIDHRIEEYYRDSDGHWLKLLPGYHFEDCICITGDTVQDVLSDVKRIETYLSPVQERFQRDLIAAAKHYRALVESGVHPFEARRSTCFELRLDSSYLSDALGDKSVFELDNVKGYF